MLSRSTVYFSSLLALVPLVAAQQPAWAQCGGLNWKGDTTCVASHVCHKFDDYYSQCIPGEAAPEPNPLSKANFWFSFGDSYTKTGFDPNGTPPAPGNPLGNPAYPGQTNAGGTNWIDVNTVVFNNSLVLTYNYAFGGATINSSLVAPSSPTIPTLVQQSEQFFSTVGSKPESAPWTSENALFSVWIGINDIGGTFQNEGDRGAFSDLLIDSYFNVVQRLVIVSRTKSPRSGHALTVPCSDTGARNFLFINVPPVERSPLMIRMGAEHEKEVIEGYNSRLASRVAAFQASHPDVTTFLWDSHTVFTAILDDPTKFGFVDATSFGGPDDFWGNEYHPSSAAHTIFAQDIATNLLADTVW